MIQLSDIKIRVEQCWDDDSQWVWELLDYKGGVICDGYECSEQEAHEKARERRKEEIEYLNSGE